MSVWKIYKSLDSEQRRILSEKVVELNRPPEEILRLLKPLAACDKLGDKVRSKFGCSLSLAIFLTIGFLVAWAVSGIIYFVVPVLIALAASIWCGRVWLFTKNIDLSNNFREFVLPVLTVLREDFAAGQPMHVRLDLRPQTAREKKTGESAPYKKGVYYKIVEATYVDPWMSASGTLTDGSKLSWSITDSIRERKKTKKNPRGKIKMKTKYSKKSTIEIEVAMRHKLYAVGSTPGAEIEKGEKRDAVRVTRTTKMDSLDPIVPRALIDVVAQIYRNARLVKKEA